MSQLKTVKLYGNLKEWQADQELQCVAHDPRDVSSMMKTWFPDFRRYLMENPRIAMVATKKGGADPRALTIDCALTPFADDEEEIHIIPEMQGAGIEGFLLAAGYTAFQAGVIAFVANMAISMALSAIVSAFAPKPEASNNDGPEENPSFLYNGPENVSEQGRMVPIVTGIFMTGSVVLATGIHVQQNGSYTMFPNGKGSGAKGFLEFAKKADWQGYADSISGTNTQNASLA